MFNLGPTIPDGINDITIENVNGYVIERFLNSRKIKEIFEGESKNGYIKALDSEPDEFLKEISDLMEEFFSNLMKNSFLRIESPKGGWYQFSLEVFSSLKRKYVKEEIVC